MRYYLERPVLGNVNGDFGRAAGGNERLQASKPNSEVEHPKSSQWAIPANAANRHCATD